MDKFYKFYITPVPTRGTIIQCCWETSCSDFAWCLRSRYTIFIFILFLAQLSKQESKNHTARNVQIRSTGITIKQSAPGEGPYNANLNLALYCDKTLEQYAAENGLAAMDRNLLQVLFGVDQQGAAVPLAAVAEVTDMLRSPDLPLKVVVDVYPYEFEGDDQETKITMSLGSQVVTPYAFPFVFRKGL